MIKVNRFVSSFLDMMQSTVVFAVMLLVVVGASSASISPYSCVQGQYFNRDKMACVPCSACPANQVPLRSCWKDRDTKCGTFGKFEFRQPISQQTVVANVDVKPKSDVTHQLPVPQKTTVMVADNTSGDRWFTITMVLVGILVFMCLLSVVLLFVSCYVCKKNKREIICDPGKPNIITNYLVYPEISITLRWMDTLSRAITSIWKKGLL